MSLETLLLLALFILLPLIARLLRAARPPEGGAPDRAADDVPRPGGRPSIRPPTRPRQPPLDARVPRAANATPVPASPTAQRRPHLQLAASGAHRAGRRRTAAGDLRTPLALRRAVVLMTVLGPCRSVAPYD